MGARRARPGARRVGRALPNGCFFDLHLVEKPVPEERRDPALRERLWQASAELAGLAGGESAPGENAASPYPEPEIIEMA